MPQKASGISGRVRKNGVPVANLNKWEITKTTQKVMTYEFDGPTDGDGNLWGQILPGTSAASGTASGYADVDPATANDSALGLSNGLFVTLDLILHKGGPWGIPLVPAFIDEIRIGTDVKDQAATFSMNFSVNGICGKTSLM